MCAKRSRASSCVVRGGGARRLRRDRPHSCGVARGVCVRARVAPGARRGWSRAVASCPRGSRSSDTSPRDRRRAASSATRRVAARCTRSTWHRSEARSRAKPGGSRLCTSPVEARNHAALVDSSDRRIRCALWFPWGRRRSACLAPHHLRFSYMRASFCRCNFRGARAVRGSVLDGNRCTIWRAEFLRMGSEGVCEHNLASASRDAPEAGD